MVIDTTLILAYNRQDTKYKQEKLQNICTMEILLRIASKLSNWIWNHSASCPAAFEKNV